MIWRSLIIFALSAATALLCHYSTAARGGDDSGVITEMPAVAGSFVNREEVKASKAEIDLLPKDVTLIKRLYRDAASNDDIHFSLVFAGQDTRAIHKPEVCLPGQGWSITSSIVHPIQMKNGSILHVRDLALQKTDQRMEGQKKIIKAHYIYWFIGKDISTTSDLERHWLSFKDSIFRDVNHRWAYPSFMAFVTEKMSPRETGERPRTEGETVTMLLACIRDFAPKFQKNLMSHNP